MAAPSTKSSILFVLLLWFSCSVSAFGIREANARGLSPIQANGMERANRRASGTENNITVSGRLQVRMNGNPAGFVRNWPMYGPISGINYYPGQAPEIEVTTTYSPTSPHRANILITNATFPAPFFVGAINSGPDKFEGSGSLGFTNVAETQPGDLPTPDGTNSNTFTESAIWSFDSATKQLKAFWINADGTAVEANFVWNVKYNILFFVADLEAYNKAIGTGFWAYAAELYLV